MCNLRKFWSLFGYIGMKLVSIFGLEHHLYWIDLDTGDVYSAKRSKFRKLKQTLGHNGYHRIGLSIGGRNTGYCNWFFVHRLVWETYHQMEVPEGMQVNHIDENKDNNSYLNLNILKPKDNSNWGSRNNKISKAMKGNTNGRFKSKYTFESFSEICKPFKTSGELNKFNHNLYMVGYKKGWLPKLFPKP